MSTHNNQSGGRPASEHQPQLPDRVRNLIAQVECLSATHHHLFHQHYFPPPAAAYPVSGTGYASSSVAAAASTAATPANRPPPPVLPSSGAQTPARPLLRRLNDDAPSTAARTTAPLQLGDANDSDVNHDEDAEPATSGKRKAIARASEHQKKKAPRKKTSNTKSNTTRTTRSGTRPKSARQMRLEKRNSSLEDEEAVPRRSTESDFKLKVVHHGTYDGTKVYTDNPRTKGLYFVVFKKTDGTCLLSMGKSETNHKRRASAGLTGRIRGCHGKAVQGEPGGEVTTITGALRNGVTYGQLELFILFYLRSLLPKKRKCIHTTESFEVNSVEEAKRVLVVIVSICRRVNQAQHVVIGDRYNDPTECKITLLESHADPEKNIVHYKKHVGYLDWMSLRKGRTAESIAEWQDSRSIMEPEEWQAATTWYKKLEFCVQWKEKSKNTSQNDRFPHTGPWGVWLSEQRTKLREGDGLDDAQKKALWEAGVRVDNHHHLKDMNRQASEAGLASLAAYQQRHGPASFPTASEKESRTLVEQLKHWKNRFYENQLSQEFVEELHGTYDLEVFNPNKIQTIQEVHGLTIAELKRRCVSASLPVTNRKGRGPASVELLKVRLLKHIFRPETFTITKVMMAAEIRSTKCCGGINEDGCRNNACATWTSDLDASKTLDCCIDCAGPWSCDLPIQVLKKELREVMLASCTVDKEAAEAKLSCVPECIVNHRCVCGKAHLKKDKMFWLQCNGCEEWYHVLGSCDGVPFATEAEASESCDDWCCSEECGHNRAIRLADALRRRSVESGHSRFDWRGFGFQVGVCYNSVPTNVSFLHCPLEKSDNEGTRTKAVNEGHVEADESDSPSDSAHVAAEALLDLANN